MKKLIFAVFLGLILAASAPTPGVDGVYGYQAVEAKQTGVGDR